MRACTWPRYQIIKGSMLLWLVAVLPVHAANRAVVEMVQMPAWLVRAGAARPLSVGSIVRYGDHIRTGAGARVYLDLPDGSHIRIGQQAAVSFYSRSLDPQRVFRAALEVGQGSFRLTTGKRARVSRSLSIRVGHATAEQIGAAGAVDLWGRAEAKRVMFLLLDGKMALDYAGKTAAVDRPMTLFVAPKNAVPKIDARTYRRWARETKAVPGVSRMVAHGKWTARFARAGSQKRALAIYDKVRAAGYAATIRPRAAGGSGRWNYDIVLTHLASGPGAMSVARKVHALLNLPTGLQARYRVK